MEPMHHAKYNYVQPSSDEQNPFAASSELIDSIKNKTYEVYNKTDKTSSYQLSIPLLASAQVSNKQLYRTILNQIQGTLGISLEMKPEEFISVLTKWGDKATFNLWLMGRLLNAANNIQDQTTSKKISEFMQIGLKNDSSDPFAAWAWGYLAVHHSADPNTYKFYQEQMLKATEALKAQPGELEKDNVQWALVMDILAAGSAGDHATYNVLIQQFKQWTHKNTLSEAILTIPKEDFTAWAVAIVRLAAAKIGDKAVYDEMTSQIEKANDMSPSDGDKLLAQINNYLSSNRTIYL